MIKNNGKKILTLLLVLSCIISGIILAAVPPAENAGIRSYNQLDSLLSSEILSTQIKASQIRVTDLEVDSKFTRRIYRIQVPTRFSKTVFHLDLHKALVPYGIETPAIVHFPERDMDIYVYKEDTVLRTIRLISDTSLDTVIIRAQ